MGRYAEYRLKRRSHANLEEDEGMKIVYDKRVVHEVGDRLKYVFNKPYRWGTIVSLPPREDAQAVRFTVKADNGKTEYWAPWEVE